MGKRTYDHGHIYRATSNNHRVYRCIVDGCPHSIPAQMIVGREAHCPSCDGDFIVTVAHLRRANLTCIGCGITPGMRKTKENPLRNVNDFMKKLRSEHIPMGED